MSGHKYPVLMVMLPDRGQGARLGIKFGANGAFIPKDVFTGDVALVKQIPGAGYRKQDQAWGLPMVMDSCWKARELYGQRLRVSQEVSEWARAQLNAVGGLKTLARAADAALSPLIAAHAPRIAEAARPYQRVGMAWLREAGGGLLAFVPRLGKTMTALGALASDESFPHGSRRYLVVAGKRAISKVWEKEITKWLGGKAAVYVATGSKAQKQRTIRAFAESTGMGPAFLVTNYETLRVRAEIGEYAKVESWEADYPELFEIKWHAKVVDETHKFMRNLTRTKGSMAARGLLFLKEAPGCMKIGLSGTPFPNRPQGLFGVLHWLAPKEFTSFWNWAKRYFDVQEGKFGWSVGRILPDAEDRFYFQNDRYILRRTRQEDIPGDHKTVYVDVWCEMEGEQKRQYEQMRKHAAATVAGGNVSATIVLTEILRLKQMAYGPWYVPSVGGKPLPDRRHTSAKYDELLAILKDELDIVEGQEKTLVFTQFKEIAVDVVHRLNEDGIPAYILTGDTSQREANRVIEDFQNNPASRYKVLVMTTQTGGTALDLYAADSVHLLDQLWNPDENLQAEERAYIPGKKQPVRVYRYHTTDSVDVFVKHYVDEKEDVQRVILDGRRGLDLAKEIITRGVSNKERGTW